jgi:hypothetical protein
VSKLKTLKIKATYQNRVNYIKDPVDKKFKTPEYLIGVSGVFFID